MVGRATLTGPGGSMKYQLGYVNGNTETEPFPVKTKKKPKKKKKTGRNAIQALASSCVALAPAKPGQLAQVQPKAPCRCRPMLS